MTLGATFTGIDGRGDTLATGTVGEAVAFYGRELPAKGWTVTVHEPDLLEAVDGDGLRLGVAVAEGSGPDGPAEVGIWLPGR